MNWNIMFERSTKFLETLKCMEWNKISSAGILGLLIKVYSSWKMVNKLFTEKLKGLLIIEKIFRNFAINFWFCLNVLNWKILHSDKLSNKKEIARLNCFPLEQIKLNKWIEHFWRPIPPEITNNTSLVSGKNIKINEQIFSTNSFVTTMLMFLI